MGPEKKSHVVTDEERRLTAYHETGHAITGYFSKHHDPVHQISIISRGGAGGYTMYLPEKDPSYVTKTAMFENIVTLLGGRVAEQLVLEDISTGASSDLQRATDTARAMVTRYGFSERMVLLSTAATPARPSWAVISVRERAIPRPSPPKSTTRSAILWMRPMRRPAAP